MRERAKALVRSNIYAWRALRTLNRGRWPTKARFVRREGARVRDHLPYVLWDPEIESFSYELANEPELISYCSAIFGVPREQVQEYARELHTDPELTARHRRRTALRPWFKREMHPGNRVLWYLLARIRKPAVTVETGIYDGLGSLVLLRALERNAADGAEGRLISVDDTPVAGELVPSHLRSRWTKLTGLSSDVLEPALQGLRVGLFFQDTPHTEANQRQEFEIALRHADAPLVLVEGSGGYCPTLQQLAELVGAPRQHFAERPVNHFYPPPGQGLLVVDTPLALALPPRWPR